MITNKIIIREMLARLIELEMGTSPLASVNDTTKNYAADFLIDDEMRKSTLTNFVYETIHPLVSSLTSHMLSKEDRFCFISKTLIDDNKPCIRANFNDIELLLVEFFDKEQKSQRISIQMQVNKG